MGVMIGVMGFQRIYPELLRLYILSIVVHHLLGQRIQIRAKHVTNSCLKKWDWTTFNPTSISMYLYWFDMSIWKSLEILDDKTSAVRTLDFKQPMTTELINMLTFQWIGSVDSSINFPVNVQYSQSIEDIRSCPHLFTGWWYYLPLTKISVNWDQWF